jgi:hypothetical protein
MRAVLGIDAAWTLTEPSGVALAVTRCARRPITSTYEPKPDMARMVLRTRGLVAGFLQQDDCTHGVNETGFLTRLVPAASRRRMARGHPM